MDQELPYRRLYDPARPTSMLALYKQSGMYTGSRVLCDQPTMQKGKSYTNHRDPRYMGNAKRAGSQAHRWSFAFKSYRMWNRHPLMRQYHQQGVLMFALRKLSGMSIDEYPGATARELIVVIGDKYNQSVVRGPVWQCFFADVYTIGGIEDHLAGHFYTLNIIADVAAEEDVGLHNEAIRLLLRSDALSEDILTAVPLSTAAQKPWKEAVCSVTKPRSFVNSNGITIKNPRGMFGDQPTNGPAKKKRKSEETTQGQPTQGQMDSEEAEKVQVVKTEHTESVPKQMASAATKEVQQSTAAVYAPAIVCLHCREGFPVDLVFMGYCRNCWEIVGKFWCWDGHRSSLK